MKRLALSLMVGAAAWALTTEGALAQTGPAEDRSLASLDDVGPDGLKRRGDGSLDDSRPGVADLDGDIGEDDLKRRLDGSIDDD